MATITNNDIARSIYLASKDKTPAERHIVFKNIIQFLSRRHLLGRTVDILLQLEKIIHKDQNIILVKASSAYKLGPTAKTHLVHALKKRYPRMEVKLDEILDTKLLGGVRLEINDEVIDLSIKNKIRQLEKHLTNKKD